TVWQIRRSIAMTTERQNASRLGITTMVGPSAGPFIFLNLEITIRVIACLANWIEPTSFTRKNFVRISAILRFLGSHLHRRWKMAFFRSTFALVGRSLGPHGPVIRP